MTKFHTIIIVTDSPSRLNISSYMLQLSVNSSNIIFSLSCIYIKDWFRITTRKYTLRGGSHWRTWMSMINKKDHSTLPIKYLLNEAWKKEACINHYTKKMFKRGWSGAKVCGHFFKFVFCIFHYLCQWSIDPYPCKILCMVLVI